MGYLHAGHLALVAAALSDGTFPVVSIFVNPTQFGPQEDYSRYPRDEGRDLELCRTAGVELVFAPSVEEMYPPDTVTTVRVARLTETLCGPHRPGHFEGVATVVAKLLHIVQPDRAYFGRKDAQQLAVLRRMVRDLDMPVEVIGCPTVREPDGLAMSSRNAYLRGGARTRALVLWQALEEARCRIEAGETDPTVVRGAMEAIVSTAAPEAIDYISLVDPDTLQPVTVVPRPVLVALAVRIGGTRLIDNVTV